MLAAFLAELGDAGVTELTQSRLVLQLGEAGQQEFVTRMQGLLDEFSAREPEPSARRWGVYLAVHPAE